ncbi:MAG TPA: cupredoxin domain-containing protein [Actinomycetota bacterium]|jgi:plastocyanin|nr:cupredoxin domain-containing protein [Actinomycetota bacterium]
MTGEPKAPRPRQSLLLPVLIPLVILIGIGIVLWGFSRLLLRMEPHAATATALVTAAGIVTVVGIVASRKRVGTGSLLTVGIGVCGVAMLASGAALLLASNGEEQGGAPTVILTVTAPSGAAASGFQNNSLTAPSDTPFTITFDNQDAGVEHDVVVASADPAKDPNATKYVEGAGVTGVSTIDYASPALPAGKYFFYCKFHPTTMTGTLTTSPGASAEGSGGGVSTSITASGLQFNTDSLTFVAGKPTQFTFNNDDAGVPHNLAIYTDSSAKKNLFRGEIVTGVAKGNYTIPALKPGTYFFRCDIHTDMTGTVTVTPAGGGTGPPPSGPPASSAAPPTSAAPPPSSGAPPPGGDTTTVTASGLAFDTQTITLPANKPYTLTFDNQDSGVPHDIAIFPDASATNPLFTGPIVVGVNTVQYQIPALKPGSYYFHCDVHPDMNGTVTVG